MTDNEWDWSQSDWWRRQVDARTASDAVDAATRLLRRPVQRSVDPQWVAAGAGWDEMRRCVAQRREPWWRRCVAALKEWWKS